MSVMDDADWDLGTPGLKRFPPAKGRTPLRPVDSGPLKPRTMHDRDEAAEPPPEKVPDEG